jgi:hypothetical protein
VKDDATIAAEAPSNAVLPEEEHSDDPTDDEEEVPVKKVSLADALNCAETLLEFLEQESDSNFSDILTLRTSVKLKRSTYGGINRSFSGRLRLSVIFLLSGRRQPVISPDNRGSAVYCLSCCSFI